MYVTTTSPEPPGPDDIVVGIIRTSVPPQDLYYFTVSGDNATQDDGESCYFSGDWPGALANIYLKI